MPTVPPHAPARNPLALVVRKFHDHEVTAIRVDGELLLIACEVAEAIGMSQFPRQLARWEAASTVRPEIHFRKLTNGKLAAFKAACGDYLPKWKAVDPRAPSLLVLTERGLYRVLQLARSPIAIAFQDWLEEEVLPSINATGGYQVPEASADTTALVRIRSTVKLLADSIVQQLEPGHDEMMRKAGFGPGAPGAGVERADRAHARIRDVLASVPDSQIEQVATRIEDHVKGDAIIMLPEASDIAASRAFTHIASVALRAGDRATAAACLQRSCALLGMQVTPQLLPASYEEKRAVVRRALAEHPEMSSRELALRVGVSHTFVDDMRSSL